MKKIFIIGLLMCFAFGSTSATIINHNIGSSNLIIPGTSTDDYVVTGSTSSNYIRAEFGYKGTITLRNCRFNFTSGTESPIHIVGQSNLSNTDPSRTNVNLILDGNNIIYNEGGGRACIQVDQGAQINISAVEPCDNSSGTLLATQGNTAGGAGIGSLNHMNNSNEPVSTAILDNGTSCTTAGGNIVISSGTITVQGGHGAGIGGGFTTYYDGMIVIYGGVVNATALFDAAGIGSGCPVGTGLVEEYAPNSAVVVLPPAVVSAKGAGASPTGGVGTTLFPELGLAGTKVRVYIGDPDKPEIQISTIDKEPHANVYCDLSQDPDINAVVTTIVNSSKLNINNVHIGQTNASGVFLTTGSLTNPTTFFTDAVSSVATTAGSPYMPVTKTMPSGGSVVFPMLQTKFSIELKPSSILDRSYTKQEAQKAAAVVKMVYNDSYPITNLSIDLASGISTPFSNLIFLAADSSTIVSAPTTLQRGDVYYIIIPIQEGLLPKVYSDALRMSGIWKGSPTGYIRQVISQIIADIQTVHICAGDSYYFNGEYLTKEGVYAEVNTTLTTCATESNVGEAIRLIVDPPKHSYETAYICTGEEYRWQGETLTKGGVYTKTFKIPSSACDSIIELNLIEYPSYHLEKNVYKCEGEVYKTATKIIETPGVYIDSLKTIHGCDSVIKWTIYDYPTYLIEKKAQICQGESYRFGNRDLKRTGDYYDSLQTINGCDSIICLHLQVNRTYYYEDAITICSNEPYDFHGRILYNSGVYYDSLMTVNGCDSIYKLTLTVLPAYLKTEYLEICEGSVLTYRGKRILEPGIYYDSLYTATGCDSVYKIVVNKAATYFYESHAQLNEGGSYEFHGMTLTEPGVYYDSLRTVSGCDSIFKLTLHENPIYYYEDSVSLCASELPYDFHGRLLYKGGVYYDSLSTQIGSDSIYRLHLTVHPTYEYYDIVDLCEGDSIMFGSTYLYNPGIYTDTLKTRMGCDSIFHLTINRAKSYYFRDSIALPLGDTYIFHGQTIRTSGTYYDYQKTYQGCDSIYEQVVKFYPSYRFIEKDTICSSEVPYVYHGRSYYESGVYYDSLSTVMGFDSIYELSLTVLPAYLKTEYLEICEGSVLTYRGKRIFEQGIYYDTLLTKQGCDSVYKIVVNRASTYFYESHAQLNEGGSYEFHGQSLTEPGVYYDSLRTISGCDSIFKLTLHLNPIYYYEDSVSLCESELPYDFHGRLLYKGGIYYDSLSTRIGSDSIYRLHLTVHPTYEYYNIVDLCDGDSVLFGGKYLYNPGMYVDTLKTRMGCDSIFHLTINRAKSYYFRDSIALPLGDTYTFHGQTIRTSGTYYDYLKTNQGCDSIYEQVVKFYPSYRFIEKDTICSSEVPYVYHGRSYYESGVYYDSLSTVMGFDSIYEFHLTINPSHLKIEYLELCEGSVLTYRGKRILEPGIYYDSLYTATGCDSVYKIVVNKAATYFYESHARLNEGGSYEFHGMTLTEPGVYYDSLRTVSGCDSIFKLTLHKNPIYYYEDSVSLCASELPYDFHGRLLYKGGVYYDSLSTQTGCDSIYRLKLTAYPEYEFIEQLQICEGTELTYRNLNIFKAGIYYDTLKTHHGCDSICKIIVNYAPTYLFTTRDSIMASSTYNFRGKTITHPGIYYDSLRTVHGCDSVYRLILSWKNTYYEETKKTICECNTPYVFYGRNLYQSGEYYEIKKDSVFCLKLTVNPSYELVDYLEICEGSVLTYRGKQILTQGIYYDSLYTKLGCDSVYKIVVNQAPTYVVDVHKQICRGDYYMFKNEKITTQGVYYDTLRSSISGCDSIVRLNLTIGDPYDKITYDTICQFVGGYLFNGKLINESGIYKGHFVSIAGCDSVQELHLTILPTTYKYDTVEICEGDTYDFNGKIVSKTGDYIDTVCNIHQEVSQITFLHLTNTKPTTILGVDDVSECADGNNFEMIVHYNGIKPDLYTIRYDEDAQKEGFENVYNAAFKDDKILIVMPKGKDKENYILPNIYTFQLELKTDLCKMSSTPYKAQFTIKYPSWLLEQNWNNVVALLNDNYNGGFSFDYYEWYIDGKKQESTLPYLYSDILKPGKEVYVIPRRVSDGVSVPVCPITMDYREDRYEYPIFITPSENDFRKYIIKSEKAADYRVYSTTGTLLYSGHIYPNEDVFVSFDSQGFYVINVISGTKNISSKIVVR